jgi:hypothetical protein
MNLHPAKPGKHPSNDPPLACLLAMCSSSLGRVEVHKKVERQTWQMMESAAALSLRREPVFFFWLLQGGGGGGGGGGERRRRGERENRRRRCLYGLQKKMN